MDGAVQNDARLAESIASPEELSMELYPCYDFCLAQKMLDAVGHGVRQFADGVFFQVVCSSSTSSTKQIAACLLDMAASIDALDCSLCQSSRVLQLKPTVYRPVLEGKSITRILESLGSCTLERFRLELLPTEDMGGCPFNDLDCPGLERTLSHERQPSLHTVELMFEICYGDGAAHTERKLAAVTQMLPKLDARRVPFLSLVDTPEVY